MSSKKEKPLGPYLGLAGIAMIVGLFLHNSQKDKIEHQVIHYNPNGVDSTVYVVKKGSVMRVGKCISFLTEEEEIEESFCERYREIGAEEKFEKASHID